MEGLRDLLGLILSEATFLDYFLYLDFPLSVVTIGFLGQGRRVEQS